MKKLIALALVLLLTPSLLYAGGSTNGQQAQPVTYYTCSKEYKVTSPITITKSMVLDNQNNKLIITVPKTAIISYVSISGTNTKSKVVTLTLPKTVVLTCTAGKVNIIGVDGLVYTELLGQANKAVAGKTTTTIATATTLMYTTVNLPNLADVKDVVTQLVTETTNAATYPVSLVLTVANKQGESGVTATITEKKIHYLLNKVNIVPADNNGFTCTFKNAPMTTYTIAVNNGVTQIASNAPKTTIVYTSTKLTATTSTDYVSDVKYNNKKLTPTISEINTLSIISAPISNILKLAFNTATAAYTTTTAVANTLTTTSQGIPGVALLAVAFSGALAKLKKKEE